MSTLVHAAVISEPNSSGEPWVSDEPFRDVYVQRNVKTLRERFQHLKKETESWKKRKVLVRITWRLPACFLMCRFPDDSSRSGRSVALLTFPRSSLLYFFKASPPSYGWRLWRPGCSGVGMTSFTCESRTPPPRPQLNDFPAAALTRPRERPPGPNWLDSVLLMVPRANVAKNSARLRITACHPASPGGQPDGWQRPGDSSRWLEMIKKNKKLV